MCPCPCSDKRCCLRLALRLLRLRAPFIMTCRRAIERNAYLEHCSKVSQDTNGQAESAPLSEVILVLQASRA